MWKESKVMLRVVSCDQNTPPWTRLEKVEDINRGCGVGFSTIKLGSAILSIAEMNLHH